LKNFVFIFARGGSKRIKNKNLQKIGSKSLLHITLNQAQKIKNINKIFLSTDSKKIVSAAKKFDVEIIMRPKVLAKDKSSEWYAWQHAIKYANKKYKFDKFICLPVTSPLRSKKDIQNCIKKKNNYNDIVITITETERNPWYNMVKLSKRNKAALVNLKKSKRIDIRQKAPKVYDMTTVCYVANPNYILKNKSIFSGKVEAVVVPKESSLDIDTFYDLKIARLMYSKYKY
jgi:N,N'-diacetyl-8-epilegionaminate cytidylyltransferase